MTDNQNIFRMSNQRLNGEDLAMLSPLQLAYIGDAVYELLIRTYVMDIDLSVNQLHIKATKYVKANAQSEIIHYLEKYLTEDEKGIVKRGRNAKTNTNPKNTSMIDYKFATAFETLFGYLYLTEQYSRITELFDIIKDYTKD